MLLATVNSGTLIIALPDLERHLHTTLLQLVWVILVYMIVSTVLVLTAGRLSDLFGRKTAYVLGFLIFSVASLGAGFSDSGTVLILWRVLQGIGGAFLFANAAALVTDAFPKKELGLAMGTNTMVAAVGLVIGPVLGGGLVAIAWQWVFWFNVPLRSDRMRVGPASSSKSARGAARSAASTCSARRRSSLGLTGLVLALSKGGLSGWSNALVVGGLAAAIVLLPLFIVIERRGRAPMLDLSLFNDRLFSAASATAFLNGLSRFALMFLFVFYFQGPQGQSPVMAGLELAPMAIGMLIASPLAGIVADRHGSRALAAARDARHRDRARGHDDAAGAHGLRLQRRLARTRRHRLGHVQQPEHRGDDGLRAGASPRDRRRRTRDASEHRRRLVDRIRDGDRHGRRAEAGALQDLLRHHLRSLDRAAAAVHLEHASRALGARGRRRSSGRSSHCFVRRTCASWRPKSCTSSSRPHERSNRPDSGAKRRDAPHDSLLRGARASPARAIASRGSTGSTPRRTSSACAS